MGANETIICEPTNGQWSAWTDPGDAGCTENTTAGSWSRTKTRLCNDPVPKFGGVCELGQNDTGSEEIESKLRVSTKCRASIRCRASYRQSI